MFSFLMVGLGMGLMGFLAFRSAELFTLYPYPSEEEMQDETRSANRKRFWLLESFGLLFIVAGSGFVIYSFLAG